MNAFADANGGEVVHLTDSLTSTFLHALRKGVMPSVSAFRTLEQKIRGIGASDSKTKALSVIEYYIENYNEFCARHVGTLAHPVISMYTAKSLAGEGNFNKENRRILAFYEILAKKVDINVKDRRSIDQLIPRNYEFRKYIEDSEHIAALQRVPKLGEDTKYVFVDYTMTKDVRHAEDKVKKYLGKIQDLIIVLYSQKRVERVDLWQKIMERKAEELGYNKEKVTVMTIEQYMDFLDIEKGSYRQVINLLGIISNIFSGDRDLAESAYEKLFELKEKSRLEINQMNLGRTGFDNFLNPP